MKHALYLKASILKSINMTHFEIWAFKYFLNNDFLCFLCEQFEVKSHKLNFSSLQVKNYLEVCKIISFIVGLLDNSNGRNKETKLLLDCLSRKFGRDANSVTEFIRGGSSWTGVSNRLCFGVIHVHEVRLVRNTPVGVFLIKYWVGLKSYLVLFLSSLLHRYLKTE